MSAAYGWPADLVEGEILERLLTLNLEQSGQSNSEHSWREREGKLGRNGTIGLLGVGDVVGEAAFK